MLRSVKGGYHPHSGPSHRCGNCKYSTTICPTYTEKPIFTIDKLDAKVNGITIERLLGLGWIHSVTGDVLNVRLIPVELGVVDCHSHSVPPY